MELEGKLAAKCDDPDYGKCERCIGDNCNVKGSSANVVWALTNIVSLYCAVWATVLLPWNADL